MRATQLLLLSAIYLLLLGCATAPTLQVEKNKVYILGSVNKQVMVEYVPGMTLLEACGHASFPSNDAIKMWVRWVDKSGLVTRRRSFSYSSITGGSAQNLPVHAGDIIYFYRSPMAVILDFLERMFQPIGSIFQPAAAATTGTNGTSSSTTQ